jgi:hypothetical protein
MLNPVPVTLGYVFGSTPVIADLRRLDIGFDVTVQLLTDYAMLDPVGYPYRLGLTGVVYTDVQFPRTLTARTIVRLLKQEADALIALDAAELYVPGESALLLIGGGYLLQESGDRILLG